MVSGIEKWDLGLVIMVFSQCSLHLSDVSSVTQFKIFIYHFDNHLQFLLCPSSLPISYISHLKKLIYIPLKLYSLNSSWEPAVQTSDWHNSTFQYSIHTLALYLNLFTSQSLFAFWSTFILASYLTSDIKPTHVLSINFWSCTSLVCHWSFNSTFVELTYWVKGLWLTKREYLVSRSENPNWWFCFFFNAHCRYLTFHQLHCFCLKTVIHLYFNLPHTFNIDQESAEDNNINIIKDDFLTSGIKHSYPAVLRTDQGYLGTLDPVVKQVESALNIKLVFVVVLGWTLLVEILFYMRSSNDTHPDTNNQLQPTELHDVCI